MLLLETSKMNLEKVITKKENEMTMLFQILMIQMMRTMMMSITTMIQGSCQGGKKGRSFLIYHTGRNFHYVIT